MHRTSTVHVLVLLAVNASAQLWCTPGSAWTFDYGDQFVNTGVHRIHHIGDTIIDGHNTQVLDHWIVYGGGWGQPFLQTAQANDMYTYEEDSVVHLQGGWPMSFDTLMWFSAVPGDHWGIPHMQDITLSVLDTATVTIDGVALRQLVVHVEPEVWFQVDTLRERIGFQHMFIRPDESLIVDGTTGDLRCFQDDEFAYTRYGIADCGFAMGLHAQSAITAPVLVSDPGTDGFTLVVPQGIHDVALVDATGRAVLRTRASGDRLPITVHGAPAGIYLVHVDDLPMALCWVKE